jgi:ATP-dependent DNA helicase MPH1
MYHSFLTRISIAEDAVKVIQKFQTGTYNILVATSIGEEGLDIGEIDVTICYDADKAPTRMVSTIITK